MRELGGSAGYNTVLTATSISCRCRTCFVLYPEERFAEVKSFQVRGLMVW